MATKMKTAGSETQASQAGLEAMYSEALALVGQKDLGKAQAALEVLLAEAINQDHVGMARSARIYLAALQARSQKMDEVVPAPELAAQIHLNRGEVDEALGLLAKALDTNQQDARLFYLKATAHALKDEAQDAADAIRQAVSLNQDFLHQYRLEKDFDRIRHSAPLAALGLD